MGVLLGQETGGEFRINDRMVSDNDVVFMKLCLEFPINHHYFIKQPQESCFLFVAGC